jgi:hypothetical protein
LSTLVSLLPLGEKVAGEAGRMRGTVQQFLTPPMSLVADSPLIRRAPRATFSPVGRREISR